MGRAANRVSAGYSPGQARGVDGAVNTAVSAAGTTISDATRLLADVSRVSTVASGAGVQLAFGEVGDSQWVFNSGANALKVYPPSSSHAINQLTAGAAHTLATNTGCVYIIASSTLVLANLSA